MERLRRLGASLAAAVALVVGSGVLPEAPGGLPLGATVAEAKNGNGGGNGGGRGGGASSSRSGSSAKSSGGRGGRSEARGGQRAGKSKQARGSKSRRGSSARGSGGRKNAGTELARRGKNFLDRVTGRKSATTRTRKGSTTTRSAQRSRATQERKRASKRPFDLASIPDERLPQPKVRPERRERSDRMEAKSKAQEGKAQEGKAKKGEADEGTTAVADAAPTDDAKRARGKGSTESKLGALNAAHASEQAFANASPNSRVGRIAAYAAAVEAGREADDARAALDALDPVAGEDLDAARDEVERLRAELEEVPGDEAIQEELEAAEASLAELEERQEEYEAAETALADAEALAEEAGDPMDLLQAAANKPVDEEVVRAVNELLGLEEPDPSGDAGAEDVGSDDTGSGDPGSDEGETTDSASADDAVTPLPSTSDEG